MRASTGGRHDGAVGLGLRHRLVGTQQVEDEMMADDPIAEARRLLAAAEKMGGANAILVPTPVLSLVAALCDRLEAAEREFRQLHANNCTPDYTERGLHSSWCRLYMVGPE